MVKALIISSEQRASPHFISRAEKENLFMFPLPPPPSLDYLYYKKKSPKSTLSLKNKIKFCIEKSVEEIRKKKKRAIDTVHISSGYTYVYK